MPGPKPVPLLERFWGNVEKTDTCWFYKGQRFGNKYGQLFIPESRGKHITAHRFSYELHKGEIPRGKFVCHTCDRKNCVNPAHLYAGDHEDNCEDIRVRKRFGRAGPRPKTEPKIPVGERPFNRNLTRTARATVVEQYRSGKWTQTELAIAWKVTQGAISAIVRGTRDLTGPPGRPRGSRNFRVGVTDEMKREIADKYLRGGKTQKQLAVEYGIDQTYVSLLVKRRLAEVD